MHRPSRSRAWPSPAASISTTPWHQASMCWAMFMAARVSSAWSCTSRFGPPYRGGTTRNHVDESLDAFIAPTAKSFRVSDIAFIPIDPRVAPLLALVDEAARAGSCVREFRRDRPGSRSALQRRTGKAIPMNIDGVTAVIFCELGFPPPLGRGLFILSRSVGILAHAWEQMQRNAPDQGTDAKGNSIYLQRSPERTLDSDR